jgi:uncharacterized protein DUF6265
MKRILFVTALVFVSADTLGAVEPSVAKLDSAAWLVGRWQSPAGEQVTCEEHWSAPAGGAMVGMFRLLSNQRPGLYELLILEEEADGVWMRLRHFSPQMVAREQEPIKLKLTSATAEKLVFENPADNRPKRVVYALAGDELTATVETERNGQPATFSLKMHRAK